MIELPRGALIAGDLAKTAEFFSFGTNDLTQTTMGEILRCCALCAVLRFWAVLLDSFLPPPQPL